MPAEQTSPALQAVAQAPQFFRSLSRLAHLPLQLVSPVWQVRAHLPDEQTSPALQAAAQTPQLARSVCRLTQVPAQLVSPV